MTDQARFRDELRRLKQQRGLSYRALASRSNYSPSYLQELVNGDKPPNEAIAEQLDIALNAGGRLVALLRPAADGSDDEIEAAELTRRVTTSDVGAETLDQLQQAADRLAMAYSTTPPVILLPRVRRHLGYVASLIDARKTLAQQRRLFVVGGWLSLLRATLHIDLRQAGAAAAYLRTAARLAEDVEDREIAAWCLETRAWELLTDGEYRQAIQLSQHAQAIAPARGSAIVQATAQEGRAWARLGDRARTGAVLNRVERMAGRRTQPAEPEHHYRYDPAKAHAYAATTLAWAGDPAAATVARAVIAELTGEGVRPRRIASARLDLGLALLGAGRPDEAAHEARQAIESGRIVPSNWWRAAEVIDGVAGAGLPEAEDLRALAAEFKPRIG